MTGCDLVEGSAPHGTLANLASDHSKRVLTSINQVEVREVHFDPVALSHVLDRLTSARDRQDLTARERDRLDAAIRCLEECLESRAMTAAGAWYVTTHIVDFLEPPDPE